MTSRVFGGVNSGEGVPSRTSTETTTTVAGGGRRAAGAGVGPPLVALGNGKKNGKAPTKYSISRVLHDPTSAPSLLPSFQSISASPYVPNSLSSLSTAFSSSALPPSSSQSTKQTAQRRPRAPPFQTSELRKVNREEFTEYLESVEGEYERWQRELRKGVEGKADLGDDVGGGRRREEELLPPLDGVPKIFFDQSFNLANPRTFDLVTERIQLSQTLPPLPHRDPTPTTPNPSQTDPESIPGLGPLTLADLATDQILQEKLSHYTAVIESHLVLEIGLRSSSFFSALSNLQSLHQQGVDCLSKIGELQGALKEDGEGGVGASAKKGLKVLRGQARRRALEGIERGVREVLEVQEAMEGVRELVEQGEWMGALEVAEQVEGMYFGRRDEEEGEEATGDQQTFSSEADSFTLVVEDASTSDIPTSTAESTKMTSATKRRKSSALDLTRIKALSTIPSKLHLLRSQIAKSLESELVSVLDHEMELGVDEYIRLSGTEDWIGRPQVEGADNGNGSREESGRERVRERAKDRASVVMRGLVRADGVEGAVASWREAVLKDIRSMVREYLPTSETPEEEDALGDGNTSRTNLDANGTVSEKSVSLAKKLRNLSPSAFLALAQQTYLGLLGTIEIIDLHSKVILSLATSIRSTERKRIHPTAHASPPASLSGSMLSVPGSEPSHRPSISLNTTTLDPHTTSTPYEDSTLASDVSDVLHAAAELANLRFSKVINVRTEIHASLPLEDFVQIFDASWKFVVQCEVLCQRMIVGLRGVMVGQAKEFLKTFHQKRLTESARLVEEEQWVAAEVGQGTQNAVRLILESAVGDPVELLLGERREKKSSALGVGYKEENGAGEKKGEMRKQVDIEGREYFAVSAGLLCVDALVDYLKIVMNCPLLTTDAMSKVVEFMKVGAVFLHFAGAQAYFTTQLPQSFNSRTCQVVLGAGAMRSAGLKNITAKHLALASQALSIMISLIPYIRETLRRHLNPKQAVMLVEFDKLRRDYQEHQNEIHSKLVAIMSDRLQVHCKTLETVDFEHPVPGRKDGSPNAYMEALVKEHMTLHKVLSRFLQGPTVDFIMGQVFSALNLRLAEEYAQIDLKTEAAKRRMVVDVKYLKSRLAELKGLERETPGTELEHLVESKITPEAVKSGHTRRESLTNVPAAALPTSPVLPSVEAVPEVLPPPPPSEPTPPLPPLAPTPAPALASAQTLAPTPPPGPVRRKSMTERLAEITRRRKVDALPAVPQEPDVEEVKLVAPGVESNGAVEQKVVEEEKPSTPEKAAKEEPSVKDIKSSALEKGKAVEEAGEKEEVNNAEDSTVEGLAPPTVMVDEPSTIDEPSTVDEPSAADAPSTDDDPSNVDISSEVDGRQHLRGSTDNLLDSATTEEGPPNFELTTPEDAPFNSGLIVDSVPEVEDKEEIPKEVAPIDDASTLKDASPAVSVDDREGVPTTEEALPVGHFPETLPNIAVPDFEEEIEEEESSWV